MSDTKASLRGERRCQVVRRARARRQPSCCQSTDFFARAALFVPDCVRPFTRSQRRAVLQFQREIAQDLLTAFQLIWEPYPSIDWSKQECEEETPKRAARIAESVRI